MPHKDPNIRRERHAKYMKEVWYPKNKKKHIGYVKRNKKTISNFILSYKKEKVCIDCGFSGKDAPYVLDFDHLDPSNKKFTIGNWSQSVLSIEKVKQEIEKCELVCANCHRIRTFKESIN